MKPSVGDVTAALLALAAVGVVGALITWRVTPPIPAFPSAAVLRAEPGDGTVTLSWEYRGSSEVDRWEYQKREYGGRYGDEWRDIGEKKLRYFVVRPLVNGRVHQFRVRARGPGHSEGVPSNEVEATPIGIAETLGTSLAVTIENTLTNVIQGIADENTLTGVIQNVAESEPAAGCDAIIGKVTFALDDAVLTAKAEKKLAEAVERLTSGEVNGPVVVTGYASADGPASHNLDLSERRADAVREFLDARVGDNVQFIEVARGERHGDAITGKEREDNRRVLVTLCGH